MVNQIVYIVVCKIINTIYGICKEVQIMILKRKYEDGFGMDEYFCELTEELDNLAGLNKNNHMVMDLDIIFLQLIVIKKIIFMLFAFQEELLEISKQMKMILFLI